MAATRASRGVVVITHSGLQWSVGHGGFFTGRVLAGPTSRPLHYVYDCGAMRRRTLNTAIAGFEDFVRATSERVEIVILSHVDWDHVNGLQRLLSGHVRVERIMLPLLTPLERLIAVARSTVAMAGPDGPDGNGGPASIERFELGLMLDPMTTIRSVDGTVEVIFVSRGDEDAPGEPGLSRYPTPDDHFIPLLHKTGIDDDIGMALVGDAPRRSPARHLEPSAISHRNGMGVGVATRAHGLDVSWILAPYLPPGVAAKSDRFLEHLAGQLGLTPDELLVRLDSQEFLWALAVEERKGLCDAYRKVVGGVNPSSICLYSGPLPGAHTRTTSSLGQGAPQPFLRRVLRRRREVASGARPGTLLTGDSELNTPFAVDCIVGHYSSFTEEIGALHLPHHGSRYNFTPLLLDRLNNVQSVVAMTPIQSRHHPSPEILDGVRSRGKTIHLVTTEASTSLRTTVQVR